MVNPVLEQELREQLDQLAAGQQLRVLEFARNLAGARVRGLPVRRTSSPSIAKLDGLEVRRTGKNSSAVRLNSW
jgi:hypothetical protein